VQRIMKTKSLLVALLVYSLVLTALPPVSLQAWPAPSASVAPPAWPRAFDRNGAHVIVYQPQVTSWRSCRSLIADTAISVMQPGADKPIPSVISWHADTITDERPHGLRRQH
jgi:hypothetical protein